jgi:hypothetical protein
MDIRQMQYEFGIQLNQFNSALRLQSDDIEYWLNKAQEEFVKTKFNGLNQQRLSFEQSQQLVDDLRILITSNYELDTKFKFNAYSAPTGFFIDSATLPNNYLYLLNQKSRVQYKFPNIVWQNIQGKRVVTSQTYHVVVKSNRFSQTQSIYKLLSDPHNTTKPDSPLTLLHGDSIDVYSDKTFVVDKVIIDYLRLPVAMSIKQEIDSELPEHVHKEIIQLAVDLFLQNTRELKQRLQRETPTADKQQNIEDNE